MIRPLAVLVLWSGGWAAWGSAQAPAIAGTYLVDYDAQVRVTSDGPEVVQRGKARLVLQQRGDSLFGTWEPAGNDTQGRPRPVRKVFGKLQNDTIRLNAEPTEAVVNVNGEEQRRSITQAFTATFKDGAITGTIVSPSPLPGMEGIVRKFEGRRQG